jgi:hypothetical protein
VETKKVRAVRGSVIVLTGGERQLGDTRSFSNQHLARPGEVVTLSADEAARLARSGSVKAVS